ncbi:hypothetical protein F2Q68_00010109 [Brassica cretica]|uniref:Uncharacterized protein n=1 Tax=Brassica cretica TaxID=69181 RepID=A0A8S9L3N4_BRACR|nr:hypothetical protein F2Q68_00010109 [Brassica cretica]
MRTNQMVENKYKLFLGSSQKQNLSRESGVSQPVLSWLAVFRKRDLWVRVERNRWSMSRVKDVWYDLPKLPDGYQAVTKQLPKQLPKKLHDGSGRLLTYLTDWTVYCLELPSSYGTKGGGDNRNKTEKNQERKGETNGEGLRSVRRTDRILSPTTLKLSGGLTDRLRCVGFWFEGCTGLICAWWNHVLLDHKVYLTMLMHTDSLMRDHESCLTACGLRRDWYQQYDRGTTMECDWNCTSVPSVRSGGRIGQIYGGPEQWWELSERSRGIDG